MRFYNFLKIIYKNKNDKITKQEEFVRKMFCSGGATFPYSEDYGKKILNGSKPLALGLRELITEKYDYKSLCLFFETNIDDLRLKDIFTAFKINSDILMDKKILCISLCCQFQLYMEQGDDVELQVSSAYETFYDGLKFGDDTNVDEKALLQSKLLIYDALKALKQLNANEGVLSNRGPFESFFSLIKQAHYSFITNTKHKVREIYRSFCQGCFKPNNPKDSFLLEVSRQSNKPLEIIKSIKYIVYDNETFNDQSAECTLDLFDDDEHGKILSTLQSFDSRGKKELFFTELIIFKLKGTNNNLLFDYIYILRKTMATFLYMEEEIGTTPEIEKINAKIDELNNNFDMHLLQYLTDGTFYPETNEIEYAPSIDPFMPNPETGKLTMPGENLFSLDKSIFFKRTNTIEEKFKIVYLFHADRMAHEGRIQDMMFEIYTFNPDGKYRWYVFPATSKAKLYRKVRYIAERVKKEKTIGFFAIGIMVINKNTNDATQMLSRDRINCGIDALAGYGYADGYDFSAEITADNMKDGKITSISHRINSPIFIPIIYEIQKNEKKAKHKK